MIELGFPRTDKAMTYRLNTDLDQLEYFDSIYGRRKSARKKDNFRLWPNETIVSYEETWAEPYYEDVFDGT